MVHLETLPAERNGEGSRGPTLGLSNSRRLVNGTFGLNTSDSCSSLTEGSLSIWLLAYNAAGNPYDIYLTGYRPELALRVTGASTFPTSSGAEAELFAGNYAWEVGKGGSGTVNFSTTCRQNVNLELVAKPGGGSTTNPEHLKCRWARQPSGPLAAQTAFDER